MTLSPTITIAPVTLPGGTQHVAYSASFTAAGGTAPYTYAISGGVTVQRYIAPDLNAGLHNSQRLNTYQNPVCHRTAETRPLVQLDLQGAGSSDPVYVYFENGAATGVARELDAVKLPNSHGLNVSAEAGTQRLAINGLPTLGTTSAWLELPACLGRQAVTTTLLDAVGRTVRSISLPAQGTAAHQLDLRELATGVYALRLSTSAGVVVKKLVVE